MITYIIILSLMIFGVANLFEPGMLLSRIGEHLNKLTYKQRYWLKPIVLCVICMPSVWGTAFALYLNLGLAEWVMLVLSSSGLNYIIVS